MTYSVDHDVYVSVVFFSFTEMFPSDPKVLSGNTLVLNCTLNNVDKGNASFIRFQYGDTREPDEYVHVLDERTSQLRKPNMTRGGRGTHYYCYFQAPNTTHKLVGHQVVTVAGEYIYQREASGTPGCHSGRGISPSNLMGIYMYLWWVSINFVYSVFL